MALNEGAVLHGRHMKSSTFEEINVKVAVVF